MKIYRVGGAVRDKLLGREISDIDWVVVGTTPAAMEKLGYRAVGVDFPVFLHPQSAEEYALARTERKSGPGYRGFSVNAAPEVTLEEDLQRRDLTINAMAEDADGNIIDPFGGRSDLQNRILRHVSPAFVEDPLRVLRVARFAARFEFAVDEETRGLMRRLSASGELEHLAPERVWTETEKALSERRAVRYFEELRLCGALARLFPELESLFGVPQAPGPHPEIDSGVHTMMVLEQACALSGDSCTRFAALVHDLGKAATPRDLWPEHPGHEARGAGIIGALCDRYRIPGRFRELAIAVSMHHLDCHRAHELDPAMLLSHLEKLDAFRRPDRFEQFLSACEADARGRTGLEKSAYPQADILRRALRAARNASVRGLDTSALSGEQIAAALRERRLDEVRRAIAEH